MSLYNLLLFLLTLAGGSLALWTRGMDERRTNYLLAFSGSFLLSITLLHLLPETFHDLGHRAGLFVLAGFFIQLFIQRFTHGVEHGHTHIHLAEDHLQHSHHADEHHHHEHHHHEHPHQPVVHHAIPLFSILLGLSIHAFMEGLPLGFHYREEGTMTSLYLAVAAHKLPEAMLLTSLVVSVKGQRSGLLVLVFFSLITPLAAVLAESLGTRYLTMSEIVMWVVPIVAGAFIHIATTIFFESGTRQHMLTWQKILAITLGVGVGLTTLLFE
jgi:zinc and cadmium transporter